jgi:stalled ribosome alternative rescue factor ArfA
MTKMFRIKFCFFLPVKVSQKGGVTVKDKGKLAKLNLRFLKNGRRDKKSFSLLKSHFFVQKVEKKKKEGSCASQLRQVSTCITCFHSTWWVPYIVPNLQHHHQHHQHHHHHHLHHHHYWQEQ